jgi:hypothetical protein
VISEKVGPVELASELLVLVAPPFVADDEAPGLLEGGELAAFTTPPDGAGLGLGMMKGTCAGAAPTPTGARTAWSK